MLTRVHLLGRQAGAWWLAHQRAVDLRRRCRLPSVGDAQLVVIPPAVALASVEQLAYQEQISVGRNVDHDEPEHAGHVMPNVVNLSKMASPPASRDRASYRVRARLQPTVITARLRLVTRLEITESGSA